MLSQLIATGKVFESDKVKVCASVYATMSDTESESAENTPYYVTLSYSNNDAGEQPLDAVTYQDIAMMCEESNSDGTLTVPGFDGQADVELQAPIAVKYSKTKSFINNEGKVQVYAALRYYF